MGLRLVAKAGEAAPWVQDLVVALDAECFPADWRVKPLEAYWWLDEVRGVVVGYGGLKVCGTAVNRGLGFLSRCGVLPDWRGQGRQKRMIAARVAYARRLGLREVVTYVVPNNLASANSLIACGFRFYVPATRWGGCEALYFRRVLG
jgi:RimJ/RimL family protein N-acetyltransferase